MASLRLFVPLLCDPAFDRHRLQSPDEDESYWGQLNAVVEGANRLRDLVSDQANSRITFTWLVRVDPHIGALHGEEAWCLQQFAPVWSRVQENGDDLGWMFYPAVLSNDEWVQAHSGEAQLRELVTRSHGAYKAAWASPATVFMGWRGHTPATMKLMSDLGVAADVSALPGWYTIAPKGDAPLVGACDWEVTPVTPFHPSAVDYRRPIVYASDAALDILELPWTLGHDPRRQLQAAVADLWRPGNLGLRRNQRRRRQGVPIQLGGRSATFKALVAPLLDAARRQEVNLTLLCQAIAVACKGSGSRFDRVRANLVWLAKECLDRGIALESVAPQQLRKISASPLTFQLVPVGHAAHHH